MRRLNEAQCRYIHDGLVVPGVQKAEFDRLTQAGELHEFALAWDWKLGCGPMRWVVESPLCDRGTALLVFWSAQPARLQPYGTREACPAPLREAWDLAQAIIRRDALGAYAHTSIRFDPDEDGLLEEPDGTPAWDIPEAMLVQPHGHDFPDTCEEFEAHG